MQEDGSCFCLAVAGDRKETLSERQRITYRPSTPFVCAVCR